MIIKLLVVAIISMVLGFVWHGPLFGKLWMKIIGCDMSKMTPEELAKSKKAMMPAYVLQFILSLVTVFFLSKFVSGFTPKGAVLLSFIVWVGFMMPLAASGAMWSGKERKVAFQMFFVTGGFNLVVMLVSAYVLSIWR